MKKKIVYTLIASAVVFHCNGAPAESKSDILTFNKRQLIVESKEGIAFRSAMEEKRKKLEADLMKKEQELRANLERFQKQAAMLSADAAEKKQSELSREIRSMERDRKLYGEDLNIEAEEALKKVGSKLHTYAAEVRKERGAKILFDVSREDVEDFDSACDVTRDIIKVADAAFDAANKVVSTSTKATPKVA